jgi:5-methylcytosine-specific restriction endonuclease McrA
MPLTEARREYLRGYYRRAPGRQYEATQRWKAAHPLNYAASKAALRSNRNAAAAGVPGHLTMPDVLALWARQPVCIVCGEGRGVDHILPFILGGPNTVDNIQTMCRPCNRAKGPGRRGFGKISHVAA